MNVNEINSNEDVLKFIEGCLNDFESGLSSKNETTGNIVDLIAYLNAKGNDTNRDSKAKDFGLAITRPSINIIDCLEDRRRYEV